MQIINLLPQRAPSPSSSLKTHTFRLQTTYIGILQALEKQIASMYVETEFKPTPKATNKFYCRDFPKREKKKTVIFSKHSRRDTLNKGHLND